MSSRVTRSSAKKPADSSLSPANPATDQRGQTSSTISNKKRKAPTAAASLRGDTDPGQTPQNSTRRRPKRSKTTHSDLTASTSCPQDRRLGKASNIMSAPDHSERSLENTAPVTVGSSSRRKSSRGKKSPPASDDSPSSLSLKRTRPSGAKRGTHKKNEGASNAQDMTKQESLSNDEDLDAEDVIEHDEEDDEDMDDDPFEGAGFLGRGGPLGISSTLRAISGMVSGMTSRMRDLLEKLRQRDDPSVQFIALQELSEILLISTEDNLAGHLSPDQYAKEFVTLMQPPEVGEENPEMMLLACRCIANLMEALPSSTAAVVYNGAVPVLLQSLLSIQYMDLAEQALITLEKISAEFPASIVREGGLMACLSFLDFFATSVQRTAVTTAANCCRNIPEDAFNSVKDVMDILLNILNNNDQRVVEQGCLCISRIVESFRYQDDKLEMLMNADLLRAILRLLSPNATNLIGPSIHTQFLRVLSITARASPSLSAALFKMNVVDTLYQILTGVSPPHDDDNITQKIDSVVIMQALIHRPRDQVFETLNVVSELLPGLDKEGLGFIFELFEYSGASSDRTVTQNGTSSVEKRKDTLKQCKNELRHFAIVLFPTLTDAYSSTVNLSVRQKVLSAQLKMLLNLDTDILEEALCAVPYASFLASILSQQDHPFLVTAALQAAELLLKRLDNIYGYQFYREGVIAEVRKLADRPLVKHASGGVAEAASAKPSSQMIVKTQAAGSSNLLHNDQDNEEQDDGLEIEGEDEEVEFLDDGHDEDDDDDASSHESQEQHTVMSSNPTSTMQDMITQFARKFIEKYEDSSGCELQTKATKILNDLQALVSDISECYYGGRIEEGAKLFTQLAKYFEGDALESITSYELLTSKVVGTMLDIFHDHDLDTSRAAQAAFVEVFMGSTIQQSIKATNNRSTTTPFNVLVQKLQDLLSRAEHFEVVTVHQNAFESNRTSAASMLAKQIRVKLVAEGDASGIPSSFRNIMVSIHAIATFKALDDYLRPRISLAERPRRHRDASDAASPYGFERAFAEHLAGTGSTPHFSGAAPVSQSTAEASTHRSTSRSSTRRSSKAKATLTSNDDQLTSGMHDDSLVKRSTRQSNKKSSNPSTPPEKVEEEVSGALECADEDHIEDDNDIGDEDEDEDEMDAIVDDLENELGTGRPDPSSVNMEVASSGRVTARSEHGTRISTPTQATPPAQQPASYRSSVSYSLARQVLAGMPGRLGSYAAAVQSTPQDWHLEFSVNGQPITNDTTIFRAVHNNQAPAGDNIGRNAWSTLHSISFKRVSGPPPAESNTLTLPAESSANVRGLPQSLTENPITADILRLLKTLHELNSNLDEVLTDNRLAIKIRAGSLGQFVNTKLTAKLNRQLEEPLIVASNCLPSWSEDLARVYPFLFPFETRHLFLQSTSFGYSRSMNRWQNAQASSDARRDRQRDERPFLGRLQRQKVRISRHKILESALKVMELYGASPSVLEVEYFEEVGTGLGPTLEFYSNVSKEFSKKKLCLWRENDSAEKDAYAYGKRGLFPAPMSETQLESENGQKVLTLFKMLGKFVARSMLDSRIIDISFNAAFFRVNTDNVSDLPTIGAVKAVDESLATSLQSLRHLIVAKKKIDEQVRLTSQQKAQKIASIKSTAENMGLDFTLPGHPAIELIPNGADVNVTIDNLGDYVDKVIDFTLVRAVRKQVKAFREGFSQVFPYSALSAFTPDELVMLFGRVDEDWSLETLLDSIKADHGYNMDSRSVRNLLQVMSELAAPARRELLQFVTGSPKLPIGGFKSLTPMLTVVLRPAEPGRLPDASLPSVMTCQNYVKLPDYSSMEVMKARLSMAVKEGAGAFHLS
ncbi:hypothetical protein FH972_023153 [Carpinus fangiana]|uniref:HECT-type E3 ubiquitin transferase n=1 Tax=Carpinus fangiana TaxID=176857 RepID=A0A5N6KWM6_9ROSI|nr:hypothetical protein FH972_023153 [Carpinus fangiana]